MNLTLKQVFLSEDKDFYSNLRKKPVKKPKKSKYASDEEFWDALERWGENPGAEEMSDLLKRKPPPSPAPKIDKMEAEKIAGVLSQISNLSNQATSEIIKWLRGKTDYSEETTASIVYEFIRTIIQDAKALERYL